MEFQILVLLSPFYPLIHWAIYLFGIEKNLILLSLLFFKTFQELMRSALVGLCFLCQIAYTAWIPRFGHDWAPSMGQISLAAADGWPSQGQRWEAVQLFHTARLRGQALSDPQAGRQAPGRRSPPPALQGRVWKVLWNLREQPNTNHQVHASEFCAQKFIWTVSQVLLAFEKHPRLFVSF